mmetsp:Transcript_18058/g.27299  ORF Transcript_18058/g.27299 Transcript_18058/m.27299 type:complete len:526 (+) Transcript_18058:83-1660(+)
MNETIMNSTLYTTILFAALASSCRQYSIVSSAFVLNNNPSSRFGPVPSAARFSVSNRSSRRWHYTTEAARTTARLFMAVNLDSNDPFEVLDVSPTVDKKIIKRAYKRLALKYHPDMVTTQASTSEEKKKASDKFAKINWAYQQLSGKGSATSSTSTSSSSSSTSSSSGYQPPHRRTNSYTSSSTDWRDYMPNYDDDEDYDASGDSFGQIFTDFVAGVATGGSRGGGVFSDFVDFLENNVDGISSNDDDAAELRVLLRTGSLDDVANEMDDTELVVQQLTTKSDKISEELFDLRADRKDATLRYRDKIDLDERIAELEARQKVVAGYAKKARKRLESLQTRYKELIVGGENDTKTTSSSTTGDYYSSSSSSSSYSSRSSGTPPPSGKEDNEEESWKYEGFGSSGRRGSSRRRRRGRSSESRPNEQSSSSRVQPPPGYADRRARAPPSSSSSAPPGYEDRKARAAPSSSSSAPPGYEDRKARTATSSSVPPHRRASSVSSSAASDKRRLQEIKVDEEFEKLKRDLGL